MSIAIGGDSTSKIYLGTNEVSKMYLGSDLVYGGQSPILPYDAEIEYLGISHGSSQTTLANSTYIDTGVYPTPYTSIEVKILSHDTVKQRRFFGTYGTLVYLLYINSSTKFATGFKDNGNDTLQASGTYSSNTEYTVQMNAEDLCVYINGSKKNTRTTRPSNTANVTMPVGNSSGNTIGMNGNLYYIKMWASDPNTGDDTMLVDMIPVRVAQVGYMYDRISGRLFGNAGSGSFTLGPDKQ